jgi:DNA-binding IclR family transcriptional regulator
MTGKDTSARAGEAENASRSVLRSIKILETVALHSQEHLRLIDVVARTGLPKTTCHRLLSVLTESGLLRIDDQGRYGPGALLLAMGMNFLKQTDIRSFARPRMEELTETTRETCHLGVLQFPWVVYLEKVESPLPVRMHSEVGAMNSLYCTGLGKALLAFSSTDLINSICSGQLEARTNQTITTAEQLREDLVRIRERGYSIDDVENEEGIRCVGAPIFGHDGTPIAAISLAGPANRLTLESISHLGPMVAEAALDISRRLGFTTSRMRDSGGF